MNKPNGLGTSDLRDTNRKIVLRAIWRDQPISRADVSRITRINKSSISSIVNGLIAEELILEEPSETTQIGRTPILITINNQKYYFVAIDVRVSGAAVALYDLGGNVVAESTLPYAENRAPAKHLQAIADEALALCRKKRIPLKGLRALGASFPGLVSMEEGIVVHSPSLGWSNVPAAAILMDRIGKDLEYRIDNSANQALRAEIWRGHSVPENLTGVYVDINESLESGIILDGKLLSGRKFGSGAFGLMRFITEGSGLRHETKTWEELVSLPSLAKRFRSGKGPKGERTADIPAVLLELRDTYLKGDPGAKSLIQEEAHWLALGISNIIVTLGFPTVVVGGYIRSLWDLMQEQIFRECESLTEHKFPSMHEIRLSSLSGRESLEGAALAAIGKVIPLDLLSLLTNAQKDLIESKVLIL